MILYESGQSTGFLDTNWVSTSVPMVRTIEKMCKKCNMTSLDKQIQWIIYIIGYMDKKKNMLMTGYIISKNFKALF